MKRILTTLLALIASIGFLTASSTTMKPAKHKTSKSTLTHHKKKAKGKKSDPNTNTGTTNPK